MRVVTVVSAFLVIACMSGCVRGNDVDQASKFLQVVHSDDDATIPPIDLVIRPADTFADVINEAVELNGSAPVSEMLSQYSSEIADGSDVDFPGLGALSDSEMLDLLNEAISDVDSGSLVDGSTPTVDGDEISSLPTDLSDTEDPKTDQVVTASSALFTGENKMQLAGAINDGYSWRDTFDIWHVRVYNAIVPVLEDQITGTVLYDPGAFTSRVSYSILYFPNKGYYNAISFYTRATTGWTFAGQTTAAFGSSSGGSLLRLVENNKSLRGKTLAFGTEMSAVHLGTLASYLKTTGVAKCNAKDNVCRF